MKHLEQVLGPVRVVLLVVRQQREDRLSVSQPIDDRVAFALTHGTDNKAAGAVWRLSFDGDRSGSASMFLESHTASMTS